MMTDKSLKDKAIDIKGKDYVMVKDRVQYFNDTYPNGSIATYAEFYPEAAMWFVRAVVLPDSDSGDRMFTGCSQAIIGDGYINKTAALENAETSAVGRALAFMGIGVIDSIASTDEINKATAAKGKQSTKVQPLTKKGCISTDKQEHLLELMKNMSKSQLGEVGKTLAKYGVAKRIDIKEEHYDIIKEEVTRIKGE
jgi:hypothetical protein